MAISEARSDDGLTKPAIAALAPLLEQGCDGKLSFEVSDRRATAQDSSDDRSNGDVTEFADFEAVMSLFKAIAPDRNEDGAARIAIPKGIDDHGVASVMVGWSTQTKTLAAMIMKRASVRT